MSPISPSRANASVMRPTSASAAATSLSKASRLRLPNAPSTSATARSRVALEPRSSPACARSTASLRKVATRRRNAAGSSANASTWRVVVQAAWASPERAWATATAANASAWFQDSGIVRAVARASSIEPASACAPLMFFRPTTTSRGSSMRRRVASASTDRPALAWDTNTSPRAQSRNWVRKIARALSIASLSRHVTVGSRKQPLASRVGSATSSVCGATSRRVAAWLDSASRASLICALRVFARRLCNRFTLSEKRMYSSSALLATPSTVRFVLFW